MAVLNSFGLSFGLEAAPIRAAKSDQQRTADLLPEVAALIGARRLSLDAAEALDPVVRRWRSDGTPTREIKHADPLIAAGMVQRVVTDTLGAVAYRPADFLRTALDTPARKAEKPAGPGLALLQSKIGLRRQ